MAAPNSFDYAASNGNGAPTGPASASAGGMTNDVKAAVGGMIAQDENKGAAVHVREVSTLVHSELPGQVRC